MKQLGYILLVDDDESDVELTLRALTQSRLANEIVVARDGAEALALLNHRGSSGAHYDTDPMVVLLDINMPKVNGIDVLKTIKRDPRLQAIPVVMLTSSNLEPEIEVCYGLGANGYVVKPVDFGQFYEAVKLIGKFWAVLNEAPPTKSHAAPSGIQPLATLPKSDAM
jgi:CheY-like chemotaxis protein